MLAITIRQPWAWAVIEGHKPVENRSNNPGVWRRAVGERIAVHAAAAWAPEGASSPLILDAFDRSHGIERDRDVPLPAYLFTPAALLGTVGLVDVHEAAGGCCQPWGLQEWPHRPGKGRQRQVCHLVLGDPVRLIDPVMYRAGQLGLWTLPDDLAEQLAAAVPA